MNSIIINVGDIPEDGFLLKKSIDVSSEDLSRDEIVFSKPIDLDIEAQRTTKDIIVKVRMTTLVKMCCVRCLESFWEKIDKKDTKVYKIPKSGEIELWKDLREDLILDFPMNPLCKEGCKGLCQTCGHNLNTGPCSHQS